MDEDYYAPYIRKVYKVFNSVTSPEQLEVARKYANRLLKLLHFNNAGERECINMIQNIEHVYGYTKGRLNVDL